MTDKIGQLVGTGNGMIKSAVRVKLTFVKNQLKKDASSTTSDHQNHSSYCQAEDRNELHLLIYFLGSIISSVLSADFDGNQYIFYIFLSIRLKSSKICIIDEYFSD